MVDLSVDAGLGGDNDLPELAAFVEARERGPGISERELRVDERLHARLLQKCAHLTELVARTDRRAANSKLAPEHPRQIGRRIGAARRSCNDDRAARS